MFTLMLNNYPEREHLRLVTMSEALHIVKALDAKWKQRERSSFNVSGFYEVNVDRKTAEILFPNWDFKSYDLKERLMYLRHYQYSMTWEEYCALPENQFDVQIFEDELSDEFLAYW